MKKFIPVLIMIVGGLLLTACDDDDDDASTTSTSSPTWTIMIYGHADHNLTPNFLSDMDEMKESGGSGEGFNVVVQADFNAPQIKQFAQNDEFAQELSALGLTHTGEGIQRGLMTAEGLKSVEIVPEQNLDDPVNLTEFVDWAVQNYPADKYGLILWDHGGQWQGFGSDEQDGTVTQQPVPMKTGELSQALKNSKLNQKWEFISFDTCLMGGAEVLVDFVDLSNVFIANPEIDFGAGWDFKTTLKWLREHPNAAALDFAKQEAEHWSVHHKLEQEDETDENEVSYSDQLFASHVIYDLTHYAHFEDKFVSFTDQLIEATDEQVLFATVRRDTTQYSFTSIGGDPTEYIDLGEFASKVASETAHPNLQSAAQELNTAINALVVTKKLGVGKLNTLGLSVWYPVGGGLTSAENPLDGFLGVVTQFLDYNRLALSLKGNWDEYLASSVQLGMQNAAKPSLIQNSVSNNVARLDSPASIGVQTVADNIYSIDTAVLAPSGNPDEYIIVGQAEIFRPLSGANVYDVTWDSRLPLIRDQNGSEAYLGGFLFEPSSDNVLSQVMLSFAYYLDKEEGADDQSQPVVLVSLLTDDNGDGKVDGAKILSALVLEFDSSNGIAPRGVKLDPSNTLIPLMLKFTGQPTDEDTWEPDFSPGNPLTIPDNGLEGLVVSLQPVPNGNYILITQAEDVYGQDSNLLVNAITVEQ